MTIDRPIFVVAPHRSGTTLVMKALARHPDVACLRLAHHRFGAFPRAAHLLSKLRWFAQPHEAQHFWDHHFRGDDDSLDGASVSPADRAFFPPRIARILALAGRGRLLAKYPRLSLRIGWLDALFPDARFIHVRRDWRAVVSSTVVRREKRAGYGGGWFGVRIPGWRALEGESHTRVAARIFRVVTRAIEAEQALRPGRFVAIDYADLCRDPVARWRTLAEALDLRVDSDYLVAVPVSLRNANSKWKEKLDAGEVAAARAEDPELFARYEDRAG